MEVAVADHGVRAQTQIFGRSLVGLVFIILLGVALRYLAVPSDVMVSTDACTYLRVGQNLVAGKGFTSIDGDPELGLPPLFPLAVGAMHLAVKNLDLAGILTTGLFGTLLIPAVWMLAWLLFRDPRISLGSALLTACHPRMVEMSVIALTEALYTFLLVMTLCLFVIALRSRKKVPQYVLTAAAGFVTGLLYLTRVIGFFYLMVFLAGLFVYGRVRGKKIPWALAAAMFLGFAVAACPYIAYLHGHSGSWSLCPAATSWWGLSLDYERNVYGLQEGSLSNPVHSSIVGLWLDEPTLLAKVLIRNFRLLFIDNFGVLFPPWFFLPVALGFLAAPRRSAWRNLLLCAMFLPLGVQLLHNFNFRYVVPLLPFFILWAPEGMNVLSACCANRVKGLGLSPSRKRVGDTLWVLLVVLLMAPTLLHAANPEELPMEQKQAGLWLKNHAGPGKIIMARKPFVSFYSEGIWHRIALADFSYVMAEMKRLGVEYLVIDERYVGGMRPQLAFLLQDNAWAEGLEKVYRKDLPQKIIIYRVVPTTG